MSDNWWKYVWVMLFSQGSLISFAMVAVGWFWHGVAVGLLAMVAFTRFVVLYKRDSMMAADVRGQ